MLGGRARSAGVEVILFNMPGGDWAKGERGITCLPGRENEFRSGIGTALAYAQLLRTPRIHAMAGIVPQSASEATCRAVLIENLKYAAAKLAEHNIMLLLEAINTRDMPGFSVSTQSNSYSICQAVGATNLKMQMDLYHMQVMEGDLATKLKQYASSCGHVQIAGCPERHEPDTGEINHEYLFRLLDDIGYGGWVGCEYRPAGKTIDGLGWLQSWTAAETL
jgi:hydroxypyruvate isomerase